MLESDGQISLFSYILKSKQVIGSSEKHPQIDSYWLEDCQLFLFSF